MGTLKQGLVFDKDMTNYLKGIGVIIIFIHHFFCFPEWWLEGIEFPVFREYETILQGATNICVPFFAFLSGYLFFWSKKNFVYSVRKITDIVLAYVLTFFALAILAKIVIDYQYTFDEIFLGLLTWDFNTICFSSYIRFYVMFMVLLWLNSKLKTKNELMYLGVNVLLPLYILEVFYCNIQNYYVSEYLRLLVCYYAIVVIGYGFSKFDLFSRTYHFFCSEGSKNKKRVGCFVLVIIILLFPLIRMLYPYVTLILGTNYAQNGLNYVYLNMEAFFVPIIIFALMIIRKTCYFKPIDIVLQKMGQQSLYMWLLSSIFYANMRFIFQPILYWPKYIPLVLIWGLFLCYIAAVGFDYITKHIIRLKNKVFFGIK